MIQLVGLEAIPESSREGKTLHQPVPEPSTVGPSHGELGGGLEHLGQRNPKVGPRSRELGVNLDRISETLIQILGIWWESGPRFSGNIIRGWERHGLGPCSKGRLKQSLSGNLSEGMILEHRNLEPCPNV